MKNSIVLFIILSLIWSCVSKDNIEETDPQSLRGELKPTIVVTEMAKLKPFEFKLHSSGKIEASKIAEIKFNISGLLEVVYVTNGQYVKQGQTLAKLADTELQLALEKAEVNLKQKEYEYESQMLSYQGEDLSDQRGEKIKQSIAYSSGLADAKIQFKEAKSKLEQAIVKAPIRGKMYDLEVMQQNYVDKGQTLGTIYTPDALEISTMVLESDVLKLKKGQPATIKLLGSTQKISAKIKEINPKISENGMVKVKLQITSLQTDVLLPGMTVTVDIKIPQHNALLIPKEAIVIRSGREVVFVMKDGLAKWHYIETGLDNGAEVEILEGLKENDKVIITNNLQLAHDAPVIKE